MASLSQFDGYPLCSRNFLLQIWAPTFHRARGPHNAMSGPGWHSEPYPIFKGLENYFPSFAEAICILLRLYEHCLLRLYSKCWGYMHVFAEAIFKMLRLYATFRWGYMQNAEAICCKVRIKTISVQLKLELGLSLAIKTSSFFSWSCFKIHKIWFAAKWE